MAGRENIATVEVGRRLSPDCGHGLDLMFARDDHFLNIQTVISEVSNQVSNPSVRRNICSISQWNSIFNGDNNVLIDILSRNKCSLPLRFLTKFSLPLQLSSTSQYNTEI